MTLNHFMLGKRLDAREIFAKQGDGSSYNRIRTPLNQPKVKIAEVYFMELGMMFRPMAGFGPSTLDIHIPYGSPVYRSSAHPLSALGLKSVFSCATKRDDEDLQVFLEQTGLLPILTGLKERSGFHDAGMIVGQQKKYLKGRNPGRKMFIVNDCINAETALNQGRTALIDVNFRFYCQKSMSREDLLNQVQNLLSASESDRVRLGSIEWREEEFHGELKATAHVYLEVDMDGNGGSPEWWNLCHRLYRQSFFDSTRDLADAKYVEKLELLGGPDMLGEYNWREDLWSIDPKTSSAYIGSCVEYNELKKKVQDVYEAGSKVKFVKRIQHEIYRIARSQEITREDYLEGLSYAGKLFMDW